MPHRSGYRLVTQNILTSAALYETGEPVTWSSLQDLTVLIDLFCLYDGVIVLGRAASPYHRKDDSRFFRLLYDTDFVSVESGPSLADEIVETATRHIGAFLQRLQKIRILKGMGSCSSFR
jgi:hypothetical protein